MEIEYKGYWAFTYGTRYGFMGVIVTNPMSDIFEPLDIFYLFGPVVSSETVLTQLQKKIDELTNEDEKNFFSLNDHFHQLGRKYWAMA